MLKKNICKLVLLPFLLNTINILITSWENNWEKNNVQKFYVTAYYSPLPGQSFYLRWDYEKEKKLNWEWVRWASGKEVYIWMLAAPKTYRFWTKIFLEWIWVWTVDDRWWAIVSSGSRWYDWDRIDMWMWYWDEWLKRALAWWKRVVYGKVINENDTPNYPTFSIKDFWLTTNAKAWNQEALPYSIWQNSSKEDIKKIQYILSRLWFFEWENNWIFSDELEKSIINFQIDNNIINSEKNSTAWFYWPKTKESLSKAYAIILTEDKENEEKAKKAELELIKLDSQIKEITQNFVNIENWETSQNVRKLQRTLKILGYFNEKDTAIFWDQTKMALIKYQIEKWLIRNESDNWAWKIGEKTISKINEDLKNAFIFEKERIKNLEF